MIPFLYLCVGISGSGKSTFAKKFCQENSVVYLSSDENRAKLGKGEEDQSVSAQAFTMLRKDVESNLKKGQSCLVDATSTNPKSRAEFIAIGRKSLATIVAYCFDTPLGEAKKRNKTRERKVPDFIINNQYKKLQWPTLAEVDDVRFVKSQLTRKRNIFVDFDRTLHTFFGRAQKLEDFGPPIAPMLLRVSNWLKEGHNVVIFTARENQKKEIQDWLVAHGLPALEVTNIKTSRMDELWDDKAIGLYENTGISHLELIEEAGRLFRQLPLTRQVKEWLVKAQQ